MGEVRSLTSKPHSGRAIPHPFWISFFDRRRLDHDALPPEIWSARRKHWRRGGRDRSNDVTVRAQVDRPGGRARKDASKSF